MKRVFSNSSDVIHLYGQQIQTDAKCSNVFFEGTTRLYSYGYHYPLALFVTNKKGERAVIVNTQGYSSTTTGHTIHLGHFQLDSIDIDGKVKAGCHTVEYTAIERVAKQLNLIK